MAYNNNRDNRREETQSEYTEKVVALNRVSKTVKGGRVMKFSALCVVGDGKGRVGYGLGKANEVSEAIRKGLEDAKKNIVTITLSGTTIPHEVIGEAGRRRPGARRHGGRRHQRHPRQVPALQQPPERCRGYDGRPQVPARRLRGCRRPGQERGRDPGVRRQNNG